MEIELPDGTILDAPDGANIKRVVQGYYASKGRTAAASKPATPDTNDPVSGTNTYFDIPSMSFKERPNNALDTMTEGIGSGMVRLGRGVGNVLVKAMNAVGPERNDPTSIMTGDRRLIHGGPFSDEAVKEQDAIDAPLLGTGAGRAGQVIGETAASLPISGAYGGVARALPAAVDALGAGRAAALAGRVLGNPLVRGGAEGAVNAAAAADPDQQGNAALAGGALGTGLSGVFGVLGRAARGIAQKSDAARQLENIAGDSGKDIFIPLSQAADEHGDLITQGAKTLYKDVLPAVPGTTGQLRGQTSRALDTVRELALERSDPTGAVVQPGAGSNPTAAVSALKDAFDQEYASTVKRYKFDVPADFSDQVETRIKAAIPDVDSQTLDGVTQAIDGQMQRFSSGRPSIDGQNLLNAKNASSALYRKMEGPERAALRAGVGVYDDVIAKELGQSADPNAAADLARYQGLADPYSAYRQVGKAAQAATGNTGQFTPRQLAIAAKGKGPLAPLAQAAQGTLGQPVVSGYGLFGHTGVVGTAYGLLSHPAGTAAVIGGGNLLATRTVQRAMMGDTAAQKAITAMLDAHPEMAAAVQTAVRNAVTTQAR